MNINKFGQMKGGKTKNLRGPPGIGFKLTVDGNYDLDYKRILNVEQLPKEKHEVSSKFYVDMHDELLKKQLETFDKEYVIQIKNIEEFIKKSLEDNNSKYETMFKHIEKYCTKNDNQIKNLEYVYTQEIKALRKTYLDAYNELQEKCNNITIVLNKRADFVTKQTQKLSTLTNQYNTLSSKFDYLTSSVKKLTEKHNINTLTPVFHTVEN